jgi:thioredoxin reductase/pSer/pThr/pTyr-binding forkhead associated (FHA) protein/ferredoxin
VTSLLSSGIPEVLDLLVVGGGPGGTAAAFRARELGLSVLVVDYDDVLKRIRDYSKDKLILPDFGGGDALRFPKGGDLLRRLYFQPIDKDEMHLSWKRLYEQCGVPVQVGVELTGLERCDGGWQARCWDHVRRCDRPLRARHVVLALGRGVPRRFDIPGNTDGIAFRLSDPALYLGAPACVIGGGTSAAEAVIAISNAKAAATDSTAVYWSYRGDRMPRVSKALADAFFNAYMGNGNIRYHPQSEPVAVVAEDDGQEYLAIRIDRRCLAGRPSETTQLEFAKERCVACIGEDIPETLLNGLGIDLVTVGPDRKRMLVTPHLETVQPGVYLVGDLLSQAYLETADFGADPSTFREVKHRGNIKSALRDGVLVAEVVAQKLAGRTAIQVRIEDAEGPPPALHTGTLAGVASGPPLSQGPPAAAAAEPPEAPVEPAARLVRLLAGEVEENETPLRRGAPLTLGRQGCDLSFPEDPTLSERHASIVSGPGGSWLLRDDGGASGVFLRARPGDPVEVEPGAILRAGRQFLVLAAGASGFEVQHYDHQGREIGRHPLGDRTLVVGREAPDVTLDAADMSLSRRHLSLARKEGRVFLKDLKSVNGTYLKVQGSVTLRSSDEIRIGRQSFRFTAGPASSLPAPAPSPQAASASPAPVPAGTQEVLFQGVGGPFPCRAGQTLCEVAEEHGVKLNAECHAGICGSDPIRILSGGEHLNPLAACEADTLQDLCGLQPGECRLACMARARGPVVVEIIRR